MDMDDINWPAIHHHAWEANPIKPSSIERKDKKEKKR
jgi:hypothetical protein